VRTNPNAPAYISVGFSPQNIAEQAFFETAKEFGVTSGDELQPPQANPPVKAVISGGSRLAFSIPSGINQIPYTLDALLDWTRFDLSVAPVAQPAPVLFIPPWMLNVATAGGISAVRQLATQRTVAQPAVVAGPPSAALASPQFVANHPTILDDVVKKHPELQGSLAGLSQGLAQIKQSAANPSAQTLQAANQLGQDAFRVNPNLGGIIVQLMTIQPPDAMTTAIEAPYRLIISPSPLGAWAHSTAPVQHNGWTELWHTRLGIKVPGAKPDESSTYQRIVRAIWSPDYNPDPSKAAHDHYNSSNPGSPDSQPFRTSLDHRDHYEIVELTSDFLNLKLGNNPYLPLPVQVNRLMLSSLGAWLDSRGAWPQTPSGLSVQEWTHRATMGRDNYVRVVYKGYLFPFGHAASLVKITERKFQRTPGGDMAAYLRQRMYIVVRQHENSYPVPGQRWQGREFPFRTIHITTQTTPSLEDPSSAPSNIAGQSAFWPHVNGQAFQFHVIAEDAEGQRSEFTIPMIFVDSSYAFTGGLASVINAYNAELASFTRKCTAPVGGTKVAFAPSNKPRDTSLTTTQLTFGFGSVPGSQSADVPPFYPTIAQAGVSIPAISQLLGPAAPAATQIVLDADYLVHGIHDAANNAAQVFAQLVTAVGMDFGGGGAADKVGGLITPNMSISGLSRELGTVAGDLKSLKQGTFDPTKIFAAAANAKILGDISLADVIQMVTSQDFTSDNKALKIKTHVNFPPDPHGLPIPTAPPQSVDTTVDWTPPLKTLSIPPNCHFYANSDLSGNNGGTNAALTIEAKLHTEFAGGQSITNISGKLTNFGLDFFGCLMVGFEHFNFTSQTGQKMQVDPKVAAVQFGGPLSFVNSLQQMLQQGGSNLSSRNAGPGGSLPGSGSLDASLVDARSLDTALVGDTILDVVGLGGGSGPSIDVQPSGVDVKYTLSLPDIAVGVMTLQNLAFSVELKLPFTGDPVTIGFAFCSKDRPFIMSYCGFAGGGYFGITVSIKAVQSVEIELWFGGSIAVDIGVASGAASIMAGIILKLDVGTITATAFIRLHGSLCILGLITLSVDFYLALVYQHTPDPGGQDILVGQCIVTVSVDIGPFSKCVDLTMEKTISGSGGLASSRYQRRWPEIEWGGGADPGPTLVPPPPRLTDLMSPQDWGVYVLAFEPV
jgi:hypothetical protein